MTQKNTELYQSLETILSRYGADSDWWPVKDRASFLELIEKDNAAKKLFEQHKALDHCLDAGQERVTSFEVSALTARVMAQIEPSPLGDVQTGQQTGRTVKSSLLDKLKGLRLKQLWPQGRSAALSFFESLADNQRVAGLSLLAASLVLGVFLGLNENVGTVLEQGFVMALSDGVNMPAQSIKDVLLGTEIL